MRILAGMYADSETGLYYNWFRYYDPKIDGYITAEPLGVVPGVASSAAVPREVTQYFQSIPLNDRLLRGLNHPYRYALNNPLRYIDPTGLDWQFTVGVNLSIGGNPIPVLPGFFGGGGLSVGFTSSGQLIIQGEATGSVGVGLYAGVGAQLGASKSKCPTESGISVQRSVQADFNFGAGPSVGGSAQYDPENKGGGVRTGVGRVGAGFGLQASGGITQTLTVATPALFPGDSPCECK